MKEFQEKYRYAVKGVEIPKADMDMIMDTGRHRRFLRKRRRRALCTIMLLVCCFSVFSVLGVSAAKWAQRRVTITKTGFTVDSRSYDGTKEQIKEETIVHHYENPGENTEGIAYNDENPDGNVGEKPHHYENPEESMRETVLPTEIEETGEVKERPPEFFELYTSWEDAREYIDFPIAYPDVTEYDSLQIAVQKENRGPHVAEAVYTTQTGELIICYTSYADTAGWDIRHEYNGITSNEREYENAAGYKISLVDNYNEMIGEKHVFAVIAFDWYEIEFEFSGYEDTQIYQLLDRMDFSVYQESNTPR